MFALGKVNVEQSRLHRRRRQLRRRYTQKIASPITAGSAVTVTTLADLEGPVTAEKDVTVFVLGESSGCR